MKEYQLLEHTADIAIEGKGTTLGEVFGAIADGIATACSEKQPSIGSQFSFTITAESPEAALYDYLDQLIYERDVRSVLPVDNEVTVDQTDPDTWTVEALARGIPTEEINAREIKAVTYSDMVLESTDEGWYAYVVFDV
ncbi:MAG: archease [Halobacteriaceae archaeon]